MPLNIIFFGNSSSEFSARYFQALLDAPCTLVGVVDLPVTKRDTTNALPEGMTEFTSLARQRSIPTFQPTSPNQADFVRAIRDLQPDLILSAGYALILKEEILHIPKLLAANFHASLLPDYRGKHPVFWALRAGESWVGLTVHAMDAGIDTGDILYQVKLRTRQDDSVATLYDRIMQRSTPLVRKLIVDLEGGHLPRQPQSRVSGSYYSSTQGEDFRLDWSWSARKIRRYIAATPGKCFLDVRKQRLFFSGADMVSLEHPAAPGTLLKLGRERAIIAAGEGAISLANLRTRDGEQKPACQLLRELGCMVGECLS